MRLEFFWSGWEAGQIHTGPAQQGDSVRLGSQAQAFGFQFLLNERIDGIADPGGILNGWYPHGLDRLKGPVLAVFVGDERVGRGGGDIGLDIAGRGPLGDPQF